MASSSSGNQSSARNLRRRRHSSAAPSLCQRIVSMESFRAVAIGLIMFSVYPKPTLASFLNHGSSHPRLIETSLLYDTKNKGHHFPQTPPSPPVPATKTTIPRHVAFICDGNSRWARARDLPAVAGHAAGADRLVDIIDSLNAAGVQYCTMYGFSTENWKRSPTEIRDILAVMEQSARRFYNRALQENVRVKILGDLTDNRIPRSLLEILGRLERETNNRSAANHEKRLTLCLAINYGGRRDIVNASKELAAQVRDGKIKVDDITEETFASCLSTNEIPDPELVIRTSGESRLSNFLLWDVAYAELYFTDVLWPDFDDDCVAEALRWYSQRRRRFGARQPAESKPITRQ